MTAAGGGGMITLATLVAGNCKCDNIGNELENKQLSHPLLLGD